MEKRGNREERTFQVVWKEEEESWSTEEGAVVLRAFWSRPVIQGKGSGVVRMNHYYQEIGRRWRKRWQGLLYARAAAAWKECQEQGGSFQPWEGSWKGEVRFQDERELNLRMDAQEIWGDGRLVQVCTGDSWSLPQGTPIFWSARWRGKRGKREEMLRQMETEGRLRCQRGEWFLDGDFARRLPQVWERGQYCRTEQGLELYVPQGLLGPSVEGILSFSMALPQLESGGGQEEEGSGLLKEVSHTTIV